MARLVEDSFVVPHLSIDFSSLLTHQQAPVHLLDRTRLAQVLGSQ